MQEEWKGLIYQGIDLSYKMEISNFGNLRNIKTKKFYSQMLNKSTGYLGHCTSLGSRKDRKLIKLHIAVGLMFIENPENKKEINHIDGNKQNNHVSNLEWVTRSENMQHAYDTGLSIPLCGENKTSSKLTEEDVRYIRENYKARHKEFGARALARKFKTVHSTIEKILNNKLWKHII